MTNAALRPSSVTTSNNATAVGAASLNAAMSDNSNSSYAQLDETAFGDGSCWVGGALTDLSLPAGAQITRVAVQARANASIGGIIIGKVTIDGVEYGGSTYCTQIVDFFQMWSGTPPADGWSDADLDGASYWVQGWQLGALMAVYELYVTVIYVVVPVTDATAPSGTFTTNNRPPVGWANTLDADGGAQTAYEVKIFSAAQYGAGGFSADSSTPTATSGIQVGNTTTWTPPAGLTNATYRAYVRVAQTVNGAYLWSAWDFVGFVVNTPAPATPTLTATADVANARVTLVSNDNSGSATTTAHLIERSLDAGATWAPVRVVGRTDGIVVGADVTLWDYEAPLGREVRYRAFALHDYSGAFTPSLAADTETLTLDVTSNWLKSPELPELNLELDVQAAITWQRQAKQTAVDVLGRSRPVVIGDGWRAKNGTLILNAWDDATRAGVIALLEAGVTLLYQMPDALDGHHEDIYLRFSQIDVARIAERPQSIIDETHTLAWLEVDPPAGAVIEWAP